MLIVFILSDLVTPLGGFYPKLKMWKKTLGTKTLIAALFIIVLNGKHLKLSVLGEGLSKLWHIQLMK